MMKSVGMTALTGRSRDVYARGRVAEALLSVAMDLLEPAARDQLSGDDWDKLCRIVRGPVDAATEAALEVLLTELDSAALEVDVGLMARLDQLRRRAFLGTD
jgi:hypothetical protein